MRRMSGLDFLEFGIIAGFFGIIALIAIGAFSLACYFFPGKSQSMIRWGTLLLGFVLGSYLAGWIVFKDLGPTFSKKILGPFFAPKIHAVIPRGYSGYVTVMFGDALGTMDRDKTSGFYMVRVGADGKAIVPCPPRLAFFFDWLLGITASEDSVDGPTNTRMFYPWDFEFRKGGYSNGELEAYYITFYFDTPEHIKEIKMGKRDVPERSYQEQEEAMIDDYLGRFGVKRR